MVPPFFAGQFLDFSLYPALLLGFVAFSLGASSIYILNDFQDRKIDRLHPTKKNRPLASGDAKVPASLALMVLLWASSLLIAFYLSREFFFLILTYQIINLGYSSGLKNIAILDIILVSSGFLFRIYSGSVLSGVPTSHWLALMVMLLSLFMALAKRRDDLVIAKDKPTLLKSTKTITSNSSIPV